MNVFYAKGFRRMYERRELKIREQFKARRDIFLARPFDPILHNHALIAEYAGCRSINITGDFRAIFKIIDSETVIFLAIGTHHELFGT